MSSDSSSSDEENRRQDVFARLQEIRAGESDARRKRREEMLGRAQDRVSQRKQSQSMVSSVRLDLNELHSKISGPRLTWDFGGESAGSHDLEIDADRYGGSESRAALHQHIKLKLSQANAKLLARQIHTSNPVAPVELSDESDSSSAGEDMPALIPLTPAEEPAEAEDEFVDSARTPRFPPPAEDFDDFYSACASGYTQPVGATQPVAMRREGSSPKSDATEPVGSISERLKDARRRVLKGPQMSDSFDFRACPVGLRSQRPSEQVQSSDSEKSAMSSPEAPPAAPAPETLETQNPFEEEAASNVPEPKRKLTEDEKAAKWEEKRKRQKDLRKRLRGFLEEAAEESDDEEFANYTRKRKNPQEDGGVSDSSESEDDADLEGLVADKEEELKLRNRVDQDQRKLSKLHGQWAAERDRELEERVEKGDFRKRRKVEIWGEKDDRGLSRRERMRSAKFDSNGERIMSSEDEDEEDEEDWLTEEEEEWMTADKKTLEQKKDKQKRQVIKKINEEKILRQKNVNGLVGNEKEEYETSVKHVSVFGSEKSSSQRESGVFSFLAQPTRTATTSKSLGFR